MTQMIMRNLTTEEVYVFTYEEWLSKTKGPKRTKVCELPAVVDDEEMVEKTTYIIQVKTSDAAGGWSSHDAHVTQSLNSEMQDIKSNKVRIVIVLQPPVPTPTCF